MDLKREIEKLYNGKLIHQFRNRKWKGVLSEELNRLVNIYSSQFYKYGFKTGVLSVPKPDPTFRNRIKFLFTGKI